jgi:hypothetical protein
VNKKSEINFDTKMCVNALYINVRKGFNTEPEENGATKFSMKVTSDYVAGGSCSYIHENAFSYCGETSLEDCRACKRPGCTVIQCGNEYTEKNSLSVPKFVILLCNLFRINCMNYAFLIQFQVKKNIINARNFIMLLPISQQGSANLMT